MITIQNDLISLAYFGLLGVESVIHNPTDALSLSPANIVAAYLYAYGMVTDPADNSDWPLFITMLPEFKPDCAVIYDTEGISHGRNQRGDFTSNPGVMIKTRATTYADGWTKINEIASALDSVKKEIISMDSDTFRIETLIRSGDIGMLGIDKQRKYNFSLNYLCVIIQEN